MTRRHLTLIALALGLLAVGCPDQKRKPKPSVFDDGAVGSAEVSSTDRSY